MGWFGAEDGDGFLLAGGIGLLQIREELVAALCELPSALAGGGGDLEAGEADRLDLVGEQLEVGARVRVVEFVEGEDLRFVSEAVPEVAQLLIDEIAVGERIVGGHVEDVHQDAGALDVAQELVAEADALTCALDESGHVGGDEGVVAEVDDTEFGLEGGERVGGDLRRGA